MRFSDPKNTLAFHLKGRPLTNALNISELQVVDLAKNAREFLANHPAVTPEHDALWFYAGNHALSAIRKKYGLHEPMEQKDLNLVIDYFIKGNEAYARMLFYCMVICFREARHLQNKTAMKDQMKAAGLTGAVTLITSVNDSATTAMQQLMDSTSKCSIGLASKALSFVFHKGSWAGGYGGKKWAAIADALVDAVHGTITPEMFTDIGYALSHNNGPIFNKGMFYKTYSDQLLKILDCQRAGQIPQFIFQGGCPQVTANHVEFVNRMKHLGEEFENKPVDWQKVTEMGAIGNYGYSKKAKPTFTPPVVPAIKGFVKAIQYWPGKTVAKIKREGLAA